MTLVLLAASAALGWGASDFFGGDLSPEGAPAFAVVAVTELIGAAALVPAVIAHGAPPPLHSLALAAAAGLAVTVELSLVYRALKEGAAFVTAPTGALGTSVAVVIGVVQGDRLTAAIGTGLGAAVVGAALCAGSRPAAGAASLPVARTVLTCVGAAAAVGAMLTFLHAAGRLDPLWATAAEHASTAATSGVAAAVGLRHEPRWGLPGRRRAPGLLVVAAVGVAGDLAYATASHRGALSTVAAVSTLYPVTTIALGASLRRRRPTPVQAVGATLAIGGAALLAAVGT